MRTPEQVKWDFVQQWLDKARKDLATADALTPYGVEFRYPGDLPSVSSDEGETALGLAKETRALIMESLRPYLDAGRSGGGEPGKL
jgi:hypothetical protein